MTFYRIPIRSPFGEFIDFFGGEDTLITVRVRDDGSELFGAHILSLFVQWPAAVDEVDLGNLSQGGVVRYQWFLAESGDEGRVVIYITVQMSA